MEKTFIIVHNQKLDGQIEIFDIIFVSQNKKTVSDFISNIPSFNGGENYYYLEIWENEIKLKSVEINDDFDLEMILSKMQKNIDIIRFLQNTSNGKINKDYLFEIINFINTI